MDYISDDKTEDLDALYAEYYAPQLASRWARLGAYLVDYFIFFLALIVGFVLYVVLHAGTAMFDGSMTEEDIEAMLTQPIFLIYVGAPLVLLFIVQCVLLATRGQSLGKMCLAVKIVRHPSGEKAGAGSIIGIRTIVTNLLYQVPFFGGIFFLVDVLFIFREDRRCIHDLMANTMVINK